MNLLKFVFIFLLIHQTYAQTAGEYNASINNLIYFTERDVIAELNRLIASFMKNVFEPVNKFDYLQTGLSFISLVESAFDLSESVGYDRLKPIFDRLNQINERSLFHCNQLNESSYQNDLTVKTRNLLELFQNYTQAVNKTENLIQQIKFTCHDSNQGINNMLTLLRKILEKNETVAYFRDCCQYRSQPIIRWFDMIKEYSFVFISLVKGCEKANQFKSDFDAYLLIEDINYLLKYYGTYTLLEEFVNDNGKYGIYSAIINSLAQNYTAREISLSLKTQYTYFDWEIYFFAKNLDSEDDYYVYTSPRNFYCGSLVFKNSSRDALISWCNPVLIDTINKTELLKKPEYRSYISNPFQNLSRLVNLDLNNAKNVVKNIGFINETAIKGLNYFMCVKDDLNIQDNVINKVYSFFKSWNSTMNCFASFRLETNCVMHQPIISQFLITFATFDSGFHIRFDPYYKSLNARSAEQCWMSCLNDSNCQASSFKIKYDNVFGLQSYRNVCFLHENNFKVSKEINWLSCSKSNLDLTKPFITNNIKLNKPLKQFYARSILSCWYECLKDMECAAVSFSKAEYFWYILENLQCHLFTMPRCFFYGYDFEATKEVGWVTFTKESRLDFKKTNLRLINPYFGYKNVTSSFECWEYCKYDVRCIGSSFNETQKNQSLVNCFIFGLYSVKIAKELGWTTHTAISLNISKPNIKLSLPYLELSLKSEIECWNKCLEELDCIATSFANSTCLLVNNTDYEVSKEIGWSSYLPAYDEISLINHYDINKNTTTSYGCFEICLNDPECFASTFSESLDKEERIHYCYLFKENFNIENKAGFVSYFKNMDEFLFSKLGNHHKYNIVY